MKNILQAFTVIGAATMVIVACNGPLFYAELEEPALCKTIGEFPFQPTAPGSDLVYQVPIPIGQLPLFSSGDADGGADGGASDFETEIRLIEMRLIARDNIPDFNSIDTAAVNVLDPSGGADAGQTLISYTKDPADLPGTTLIVAGDQGVNLVPYLFDATGFDAGVAIDGGAERSVLVEATMTGTLPDYAWTADVRVCIYMRTRFNYLNAYGL